MCKSVPAVFLFVRRKQVLGNTVECRHCVARTGIFCGFPLEWLTKCAESDIIEMLRSCVLALACPICPVEIAQILAHCGERAKYG